MDSIRFEVTGNTSDQTMNGVVHGKAMAKLKEALATGVKYVIWDNTTIAPKYRSPLIRLAKSFRYRVVGVFFDVSLNEAKTRNGNRSRVVPEDVLDRMHKSLTAPALSEGFDEIIKAGAFNAV